MLTRWASSSAASMWHSGCVAPAAGALKSPGTKAMDPPEAAVSPPCEGAAAPGAWAADLARDQCLLGPLHGANDDHRAL